jgi:hypothetical protein
MNDLEIEFGECFSISVLLFVELLYGYKEHNVLIISIYSSLVFAALKVMSEFFKAYNYCYELFVVDRVVKLGSI